MVNHVYIIGAGGVGSWLTPAMVRFFDKEKVTVIDGDRLEPKNLDRQLFTEADLGKNKAEALAELYGCQSHDQYFHANSLGELYPEDWILGCVDNHRARKEILAACDMFECQAIFGANEQHSAEAYFYYPWWQDTDHDPRIYYPEILTDRSGDPMARGIGCTGQAAIETPQLVTSNCLAAALMGHLMSIWAVEVEKLDADAAKALPYKLSATLSRLVSERAGEIKPMKGLELCQNQ